MRYFVSGKLKDRNLLAASRSDLQELVQKLAMPSINQLLDLERVGRVVGGGFRASSPDLVLILDVPGDTHMGVRGILSEIPLFGHYDWEVTPLETFTEWQEYLR